MKKCITLNLLGLFFFVGLHNLLAQNIKLDSGLIAYYPFDGNANDLSVNHNTGILKGDATFSSCENGQALELGGTRDYLELGNGNQLGAEFTVSTWILLHNSAKEWPGIYSKGSDKPSSSYWFGLYYSSPFVNLRFSSNSNVYYQVPEIIPTNVWTHIAYMAENSFIHIYLDGNLVFTGDLPNSLQQGSGLVVLGASSFHNEQVTPANSDFDGKIDEFRVYNRSLTDAEIDSLANDNRCITNNLKYLTKIGIEFLSFPEKGLYEIQLPPTVKQLNLNIYSTSGAEIYSKKYDSIPSSNKVSIDLHGLAKGIYLIQGIADDGYFVKKVYLK